MPPVQSTLTLPVSSGAADGHGTNTLAGESKANQQSTQHGSPAKKWKPAGESESFSGFTTSEEPSSLLCAEKEVAKRKHEMEGLLKAEEDEKLRKKKKKDGKQKVPSENHMKLRAVADAERKWELELESVHGLSDLEACVCVGIVAKYHKNDSFPDSDPQENQKYLDFAREGWRHMKELHELMAKYPECLDQMCINGEWRMHC